MYSNAHTGSVLPILFVVIFSAALVFVALAPRIIDHLPVVKRLRRLKEQLLDVQLELTQVQPNPIGLSSFLNRELHEVTSQRKLTFAGVSTRRHTMAQVVSLAQLRDEELAGTTHELRVYAASLFFFGVVLGGGKFLGENQFAFSPSAFAHWINEHPLEVFSLAELIMIGIFAMKLFTELHEIEKLLGRPRGRRRVRSKFRTVAQALSRTWHRTTAPLEIRHGK